MSSDKQESRREIAERVCRQWVEHDLDDHYESGVEFIIEMPPAQLIERIEAALKDRDERAARIADAKADEWGTLADRYWKEDDKYSATIRQGWAAGAQRIAAAIRNEEPHA